MPETKIYDQFGNPIDSAALGNTPRVSAPPFYNSEESKKEALSESSLKEFFNAMWTFADEHRKPREIIWDQCMQIYNNEYDWSQKAWWQHKAPIPKVRSSVDKAVALFRKTLLRMYPFYGVQAESKMGRTKGRFTMLLCDYWFDQIAIIEELVTAFKISMITSVGPVKIWWQRTQDFKPEVDVQTYKETEYEFGIPVSETTKSKRNIRLKSYFKGKLGVKAVNPKDLWVIPATRGRGWIERDSCTLNELESLAEEGVYDKEAVERLRDRLTSQDNKHTEAAEQTGEGQAQFNQYLRVVDLWHYWGDVYDKQGRLVECDSQFTMADKDILIKKARPNPFFHKQAPYVMGSPYTVPFSTYNRGMVEDIMEIARSITEMANLIADGALYDALKSFAVDVDQLDNPEEAKQGVYPGKVWQRHSNNAATPNEQLVQTVEVGKVPTEANNMIAMMEKYYQEGSYINEYVGGFGGGKGDKTLGEVNIKTQAALEGLDEAARNLEVTLIEPAIQMSAQVIYQFQQDYTLSRLMDNYPQVATLLQGMQPAERYSVMIGDFAFKVRGLSVMIDRNQRMGELKEILQLLSYLPGFVERMNPDAVLEEVLMPLGWDPRRLLINPGGQQQVTTPMAGAQPPSQMSPQLQQLMQMAMIQKLRGAGANRYGPGTGQPPIQGANAREGARPQNQAQNPMAGGR